MGISLIQSCEKSFFGHNLPLSFSALHWRSSNKGRIYLWWNMNLKGAERQAGASHCWPPGNFQTDFTNISILTGRTERGCQDTQLDPIRSQDALRPCQVKIVQLLKWWKSIVPCEAEGVKVLWFLLINALDILFWQSWQLRNETHAGPSKNFNT